MTCFICGSAYLIESKEYLKCSHCQHQVIKSGKQTFIVNDILEKKPHYRSMLDLFQERITRTVQGERKVLLDIGCGSGRYLALQSNNFEKVLGIEVSELSIQFARNYYGLKVERDLRADVHSISVVTFWHSLEHIPTPTLMYYFTRIKEIADHQTRIIISVPNSSSLQYQLFGRKFAYCDVPNHFHQFSYGSLLLMMKNIGFIPEQKFFSLTYILFGYCQGLMNFVNSKHNYFYYRQKRGETFGYKQSKRIVLDSYNYFILLIIFPFALVFTVHDFLCPTKAAVLTINFKKS